MPAQDFLNVMQERGFVHQVTDRDALAAHMAESPLSAYIGFDCTGPSLHVGSLVQIMMLRWLQKCGHKPVVLLGGGTSRVGDPSGKDQSRQLLTDEQLASYQASIKTVFDRFLQFGEGATDAAMVDNADWLNRLDYLQFLREMGPHFTINRMLTFDSVKLRLDREQPLTFLEFNYMILQAYDFLELNKRRAVSLQMGGSDQWGNIINGIELCRRVASKTVFGLTTPLITTADGKKMGKTEAGAIWLNEASLPSYDYWQFWRNTQDADVGRFLRLFTDLPLDEIEKLDALQGSEINAAKVVLANEATRLCRGDDAARRAAETAAQTFAGHGAGTDLPSISYPDPTSVRIIEAFIALGLAASNGEARRLAKQGGVKVNGTPVHDLDAVFDASMVTEGQIKVSAGKKRHALVKIG